MTDSPRRATSADVARAAGLSRATVSYVLNDTPHQKIPEGTRRRVLEAAARLGYSPSAAARSLRSGRSDVVLLLLPDWPVGPAVGALMQGLSVHLAAAGLTFMLHPAIRGDRTPSELWRTITPAAVLTFEEFSPADVAAMRAAGIAVVVEQIGVAPDRSRPGLEVTQQLVGRMQLEHLAAGGHTRFGYAWPGDSRVLVFAEPRLDGARRAAADLGLPEPAVRTVPLAAAGAADAVRAWARDGVTGICAYNDETALAVLAGARALGLDVPADLAVIGVDDIPAGRLSDPSLTTVVVDTHALAGHLAEHIVASIAGRPAPARPGPEAVDLVRRGSA